ncbi:MAG TPA: alpha/beta hydrolase [Lapillicoccus sp.]|jgi:pimeloyl-ACP methyl ester carboxylesterase|uniref:alpha/beta fold hydrolase n=1 Tax=Lapillicoccus sp. TaxID=1909287 RepID=UPI002F9245B9
MSIAPTSTGYADVNGLHLYYETYGSGAPLVLLHGGMLTIDLNFASLIPALAQTHTVIGVEMQGHGRTANIDREITYANLATDIVALLDHLGIERAAVLGHSMGGGVALEMAVNHADRVSAIVPISASVSKDGMHPDLLDPSTFETSSIMPTAQDFADFKGAYERLSPHPEQFDAFLMSLSGMDADFAGWTDEQLAGISCPVLIVQGDNDFTTVAHAGVMLAKIPNSTLAVIPGTTHMQVTRRDTILLPVLERFFAAHPGV